MATSTVSLQAASALSERDTAIPGYSYHEQKQVAGFLRGIGEEVSGERIDAHRCSPAVQALDQLLQHDPIIGMYAAQMIEEVPDPYRSVANTSELLLGLQLLSTRAPDFNADPAKSNFFPASTLFVHMMMTPAGQALFRMEAFNAAVRGILKSWCQYLDSPQSKSVLHTGERGWLSRASCIRNNLAEYETPNAADAHWGFRSFNAFFHRQIRRECRTIAEPKNPKVIISPNDGTLYKVASDVKNTDRFWVKSQPYSLEHMLGGDVLSKRFVGGTVYQSFLDGRNYHRFWSPVSGRVRKIHHLEGLMFSNAESAGRDLTAGTYSQAYMACVNTRSLVFIESDDPSIGLVCLMAIGISEVSSIAISVNIGQAIEKGDEVGYFSYGGSSVCLLFEPKTIREFTIDISDVGTAVGTRGVPLKAGQSIALC